MEWAEAKGYLAEYRGQAGVSYREAVSVPLPVRRAGCVWRQPQYTAACRYYRDTYSIESVRKKPAPLS